MPATVYLLTPPFTQLNTPYPATAYLKGFLNTRGISAYQSDLGIEVTLKLFSRTGLKKIFEEAAATKKELSENTDRILSLKEAYLQSIDPVIRFLQGRNPTLAHRIASRKFLPETGRFAQLDDLAWAFGNMGVQDKAKHIATLFMEDLSDFIQERIDEHFGFSRYAEKLGRSAQSFDELHHALQQPYTFVDELLTEILRERLEEVSPKLVAMSVPFPGNLYAAFRSAQYIRSHCPGVKIAMGGGFPNTELRSLADKRVFEYFDYITLDDGEAPLENLVHHIEGKIPAGELKRTFLLEDGGIRYINSAACTDYKQSQVGTPDYSDLFLDQYISVIEILNPMHRLWSDGRWNKLTMAHGCYWGKCTFCDISLDYIKLYEPVAASLLCDRMEELMAKTGENGFHFVDEAAPPALMRALALEIVKRKLVVSWWTNIRFEKSFTRDLCILLRASGCIGVSGGLEVASDRLLALIQKGITVAQVARVNRHFTEAGIMVHAYLMYGFPTQTDQETIDSLEMVRQMFASGILQSAYWHLFTMTAHSPVGLEPEKFNVKKKTLAIGSFANNDLEHEDPSGGEHERYAFGLKKSLLNYMHSNCLDYPLQKWFDFKVPRTNVPPDHIMKALGETIYAPPNPSARVLFLGPMPVTVPVTRSKKGMQWEMAEMHFEGQQEKLTIRVDRPQGEWLRGMLEKLSVNESRTWTYREVKEDYENAGLEDFELFWDNKPVNQLYKAGLVVV